MITAIRSVKNQYRGINAHLHSYWQSEGHWQDFHTIHIGDISKALNVHLLPMGYAAEALPSLQIRRSGEAIGRPISDLTIYDLEPQRRSPQIRAEGTNALILPVEELLQEEIAEKPYQAVAIYEFVTNRRTWGEPVAWIELLSPSNKGNSEDARDYRIKRSDILHSGIVFVEIDYLHESPPTFPALSLYHTRNHEAIQPDSHPYRIVVIDPRPNLKHGEAHIHEFDVDTPLPGVTIPLNKDDQLPFDFGEPYRRTFEEMFYGLRLVDYSQLPLNFDRYSADDQSRIARRMLVVLEAHTQGTSLENEPLPIEHIPLETALAELKTKLKRQVE